MRTQCRVCNGGGINDEGVMNSSLLEPYRADDDLNCGIAVNPGNCERVCLQPVCRLIGLSAMRKKRPI